MNNAHSAEYAGARVIGAQELCPKFGWGKIYLKVVMDHNRVAWFPRTLCFLIHALCPASPLSALRIRLSPHCLLRPWDDINRSGGLRAKDALYILRLSPSTGLDGSDDLRVTRLPPRIAIAKPPPIHLVWCKYVYDASVC